jgi:hypothetical protein
MFGFPRLRALIAEHGKEGSLGEFLMEELYSFVGEGGAINRSKGMAYLAIGLLVVGVAISMGVFVID